MVTPHIAAEKGDFAKTVLMPGDPLRAKFVAENFLENPKQVTGVRNVLGYTGNYQGKKVSVMASGMGMPSISIYASELYEFFGVENIIRIGTTGAIQPNLELGDLIIVKGASYDSGIFRHLNLPGVYSATPSWDLLSASVEEAKKLGIKYQVGDVLSEDTFYNDTEDEAMKWAKMGILALEMESAALFAIAARKGKRAHCLLTVSDSLVTHKITTSEEREKTFTDMMKVGLGVAAQFS